MHNVSINYFMFANGCDSVCKTRSQPFANYSKNFEYKQYCTVLLILRLPVIVFNIILSLAVARLV